MSATELFKEVKARNCVDYLLRNTQQHHVQLSAMADQKANILLGVAAIILTLILGNFKQGDLQIWGMVLGFFVLLSAIFALMAIMPTLKRDKWPQPNWLFFGAFAPLDADQYKQKMAEIMKDDALVYEAIVNEIYQLGQVLHFHKYRYMKYSYQLFLAGLLLASFAWVVERALG